ncbi:MAG TPA: hypothetical protein VGJ21_15925 [Terracidiphilus sp.]
MGKDHLSPALSMLVSETATWCNHKPFRSPALDPSSILEMPDWSSNSEPFEPWAEKRYDPYRRAISWINETRSELLRAEKVPTQDAVDALSECRLLLYWPMETVEDGASKAGSMGFYDLCDAPPWDTWFLYANHAIFCCVPQFAIPRAQDGMDGNPVACIEWADWSSLTRLEN